MLQRGWLVLGIALLLPAPWLQAANISGTVLDEGEPVPMAEVILIDVSKKAIINEALSGKQGGFRFQVPKGKYSLRIAKEGYAFKSVKDLEMRDRDIEVQVELLLAVFADNAPTGAADDCD